MSKVLDYEIVVGQDTIGLWRSVMSRIKKWFSPLGGVTVSKHGNYIQAMVKYEH